MPLTPFFYQNGGGSGGGGGAGNTQFTSTLISTIVPQIYGGSGTPTFTAASTRYQFDFEAKANLVLSGEVRFQGARRVRNWLTFAEDFSNAAWTKENGGTGSVPTFTSGFTAPDGTATAWRFQANRGAGDTGSDFSRSRNNPSCPDVSRRSTWIKSNTGSSQTLSLVTTSSSHIVTATTDWQRLSSPVTASGSSITYFDLANYGPNATTRSLDVLVWHPQLEDVTGQSNQNPSEYVSVGVLSAPYHGANVDGVKYFTTLNGNTVASNVVTEATGAKIVTGASGVAATAPVDATGPFGQLSEGARGDVLGTTAAIRRTMADAGWVAGATMTKSLSTGIDGVASAAATMTGGAVGATNTVLFTTVLGSTARTYGVWARRRTGTGTVEMTDNNGTNYTDITATLTTAWKLFPLTRTQANPVVGFRITTNLDAIDLDFETIDPSAFANPTPIPVNVSKAADVMQYVSASNISATSTAVAMSIAPLTLLGSATVFHFCTYVDANNYTAILSDGTNLIARKRIAGVNADATIAWARAINTAVLIGARFDTTNGVDVWLSGTKGTGDATLTASQIGTNFQIGADGNGANQHFSTSRLFSIYIRPMNDAQMASLTD